MPTDGVGNITNAPLFVKTNGWSNLRLQSNSPCINAGLNAYAPGLTDLDGNPRIAGGRVDLGAYEFQGTGLSGLAGWLWQYGLPTDGSADYLDTAHDGHNNWQEWRCQTDPTNPLSALLLLSASRTGTNVAVAWQCDRGRGRLTGVCCPDGLTGRARTPLRAATTCRSSNGAGFQNVLLIGYSKGALDVLRFLVDFPVPANRVAAVVSLASPVFGTPVADRADAVYSALLAKLPYDKCPPGDGEVIRSLSPATATQWLAANPLPGRLRYYSLAAFTKRQHVARALVAPWKFLNGIDARNDGQVVAADAVIPGATLLGYANADHWGVAQRVESAHAVFAARPDPEPFPLEQLFLSIVQVVSDDLRNDLDGGRDGTRRSNARSHGVDGCDEN